MDEELAEAREALATFMSRPLSGLSDEALTATLVDVYALRSQAIATVATLAQEARGREQCVAKAWGASLDVRCIKGVTLARRQPSS